jgi:hypothetical protein
MQGRLPAGARTIEVQAEFVPRSSCAAPARAVTSKSATR